MRTLDPFHFALGLTALLGALAAAGGCGSSNATPHTAPPPASAAPEKTQTAPAKATPVASALAPAKSEKPFDPCDTSGPVPKPYFGILSVARCEQDMFLTMANVVFQLGVECKYCHAPHPTDPKKEDYPVMTPKKETANWMKMHLMASIKPADGSQIKCRSCHTDSAGKPIAKILGNPRDIVKAQEWMSMVMVNKFVSQKGEKLKCKSCHAGNFATPQFQGKVILQTAQIPPHETP